MPPLAILQPRLHVTADTPHLVHLSVALLKDLLGQNTELACWRCWLKHLAYLQLLNMPQLTQTQILELEALVIEHQGQFAAVEEYKGLWKPKHHFALHLARDIRRFGPPRGYWCMAFEAFNQLIKRLSEMSNYKSQLSSVVNFWLYKSARNLIKRKSSSWAASEVCIAGEATLGEAAASTSPLLNYIAAKDAKEDVHLINILCSFTLDGNDIREGDWVSYAIDDGASHQQQMLLLVDEMVELVHIQADAPSYILLLGCGLHAPAPCAESGGLILLPQAQWESQKAPNILHVSGAQGLMALHVSQSVSGQYSFQPMY